MNAPDSEEAQELAEEMFHRRQREWPETELDRQLKRIKRLTKQDLTQKSFHQLAAKAWEEIGELARELQIEGQVYGNTYKVAGEGTKGECADVFIMASAMFYASGGKEFDRINYYDVPDDVYVILSAMAAEFGAAFRNPDNLNLRLFYFHTTAQSAVYIFLKLGGGKEDFVKMVKQKLNKWETTNHYETKIKLT